MTKTQANKKTALIVVDVQVGVMDNVWESKRIIQNIQTAVKKARQAGMPVIWVQHADPDDGLTYGSPEWEIVPELVPAEGETRIYKNFNSSFENTELETTLKALGVDHIVLAGAATNWCIRATAYGALDKGFNLTLVKDAHTTDSIEFQDGYVVAAESIIRDLNVAMTWVNYADVKNTAVNTEELDFTKLATA